MPELAAGLHSVVTQLHSSAYRNPHGLPNGPVLVVGGGNSGRQIARELAATRRVELATADTATVVPQRLLGRDLFWWLDRSGLLGAPATSRIGRPPHRPDRRPPPRAGPRNMTRRFHRREHTASRRIVETFNPTRSHTMSAILNTRTGHFVRHYLEMVVAMLVGMIALGPLWSLAADALGWSAFLDLPEPMVLVMATNMTVAMSAWMRYRGHGWPATLEMAAAMYLPFLALFPPLWLGVLSPGGLMLWGHVLMLPAMAAAMLWRLPEYTGHHAHAQVTA